MRTVEKCGWFFQVSSILLLAGLAARSRLPLLVECTAAVVLFLFVQIPVEVVRRRNADKRKSRLRWPGLFLMPPALCIIASAVHFLFRPQRDASIIMACTVVGAAALLLTGHVLHLIACRKDRSVAARISRQAHFAAMAAPASLVVTYSMTMQTDGAEEFPQLVCMSVAVFGGLALLIAANLVFTSHCGHKTTRESIRLVSGYIRERRLLITRAVIVKDAFLVIGKLVISIASVSFFMFANALFSVGMGIARFSVIRMSKQDQARQIKAYRRVGAIIAFSGLCFVLYSVRLFFSKMTASYPMSIALVIACYTFVEFGVNIRDAWKLRKSNALVARALRSISFASTLLCFVLTQTAIMSFAHEGDSSFSNALAGTVFGGMAALIGAYVVFHSYTIEKSGNE